MQRRRQVIWIGVFDDVDVLRKKFSHLLGISPAWWLNLLLETFLIFIR